MQPKIILADDLSTAFFKSLESNNFNYALLTNNILTPNINPSVDFDILLNSHDFQEIKNLLIKCALDLKYSLIWLNPLNYLTGFVFVKVEDSVQTIKFNLFNGLIWRGMEYLSTKVILSNRKKYNDLYFLNSIDESIIIYFYYTLHHKKLKHHDKIINSLNCFEIKHRLKELFNFNNIHEFINVNNLNFGVKQYRKKIILKLFFKSFGVKYFFRLIKHLYIEYVLRLNFGYFISFSGPDGAGKSTLVDTLNTILFDLGITDKKIPNHLLSEKIPALHKSIFANKSRSKNQVYNKPYSVKPVSYFESFFRTVYYFVIFVIDGLLIFNRKRKNNIVIYDRYIMDFSVDTKRMRIKMPDILSKLILRILKFDNLNVLIIADANQILTRKDELSKDQLIYLLERYNNLSDLNKRSIIFENSNEIYESKLKFLKLIFLNLNNYYLKKINNN